MIQPQLDFWEKHLKVNVLYREQMWLRIDNTAFHVLSGSNRQRLARRLKELRDD